MLLILTERSDSFLGINLACFESIEHFYAFIIFHNQLPLPVR
jgi:hypothetical protein